MNWLQKVSAGSESNYMYQNLDVRKHQWDKNKKCLDQKRCTQLLRRLQLYTMNIWAQSVV